MKNPKFVKLNIEKYKRITYNSAVKNKADFFPGMDYYLYAYVRHPNFGGDAFHQSASF